MVGLIGGSPKKDVERVADDFCDRTVMGETLDHFVARMMAKGIVNKFEPINVREDQRSDVIIAQVAQERRDTA